LPREDAAPASPAVPVRSQPVRDTTTGAVSDWAVYDRAALAPGVTIAGPAIVAEDETSTLIGSGWMAAINRLGYIELLRS
jgi:N-methylhydantoinase A